MKKMIGLMFVIFFGLTNMNAMSYEEARDRARFLTDKMAYELNLNEDQYNDAYEINLDYLMNIRTANDISGVYLEYRNADLRHILYDWQYTIFRAADYFFRPIVWRTSGWYLPVYRIYPTTRYYYNPPRVYSVYRGGNYHYRFSHPASFYANRRPVWNGGFRGESRGPVGRPGHRPDGRHPAGRPQHNGFRFEPTRPQTGHRPTNDHRKPTGANGVRPQRPKQPGKNDAHRPASTRPGSPAATRPNNTRPQGQHKTGSKTNYTRPSSTRTTVKRAPQSSTTGRPTVQRGGTPRKGNTPNGPQHSSGPSRSGR